jgi:hypothetical protein
MRRIAFLFAASMALAVPALAVAVPSLGDGSLVVRNGSAPQGTPVIKLTITGSVIGHVDNGKLVIDAGVNPDPGTAPVVTGADWRGDSTKSDTAQIYKGDNFRFRAVGGRYTVLVYGTGIDLVAAGTGTVQLAGLPDTPHGDGSYSLNGNDFVSLPGNQMVDKRSIGSNG